MEKTYRIIQQLPRKVGEEIIIEDIVLTEVSFDINTDMGSIRWNSKTGLITQEQNKEQIAIPYTGNGVIQIQPGYPIIIQEWGYDEYNQLGWYDSNTLTLHYQYWYY